MLVRICVTYYTSQKEGLQDAILIEVRHLLYGWMDGRVVGWVGGWMSGWVGGWMDGWMDGRVGGSRDR
jgi:hypothetical protein